jgi:hypothetical protein
MASHKKPTNSASGNCQQISQISGLSDILSDLQRLYPLETKQSALAVKSICESSLAKFSRHPRLLATLANAILLIGDQSTESIAEARPLIEEAECSTIADGFVLEVVGDYFDTYTTEYARAESAYARALSFEPAVDSVIGLSRVLAQRGDRERALEVLSDYYCHYDFRDAINVMRQEILDGLWDIK